MFILGIFTALRMRMIKADNPEIQSNPVVAGPADAQDHTTCGEDQKKCKKKDLALLFGALFIEVYSTEMFV